MKNMDLFELSQEEMSEIIGGDKFMKDLGHAIGSAARAVRNFISSSDVRGSETLMNCI